VGKKTHKNFKTMNDTADEARREDDDDDDDYDYDDDDDTWTTVVAKMKASSKKPSSSFSSRPPRAPSPSAVEASSLRKNSSEFERSCSSSAQNSRRNSLSIEQQQQQRQRRIGARGGGGGIGGGGIKSTNSWDALRQRDEEEEEESQTEEFEDAKDKLVSAEGTTTTVEEEDEEEMRRKQRKKEKKKLRRKMKAAQQQQQLEQQQQQQQQKQQQQQRTPDGATLAKQEGESPEEQNTKTSEATTTSTSKLGASSSREGDAKSPNATMMRESESCGSLKSLGDEDEEEDSEEWKMVESKKKKSGSSNSASASNLAKMAMMRNNSGTTELTSMSSSSQHLQQEERGTSDGSKNKQKKKKKKSKSNKKEEKGGSSSGYSSEPESPLGTDSSFSLSTPNANSSQENIAHIRTTSMNAASRLNTSMDASTENPRESTKTQEKKLKDIKTTTSTSDATMTATKKKSAIEEIAQMVTKNTAFDSDDSEDDVSERRRKQHEREKSSTRFPSTEKLIVLPPTLTSSTSPVHRPSSPSLARARRESDESSKINALRRQLSSASRQQQQYQQQQQRSHHGHTLSSERTFSEDLPLVPGRWAHFVNKLDEWVYFFTDVFWKSLGAFLSTILNWFRGGTSKKTEEAQRRARANLKRIRKENSSQNLINMSQQSTGRTPTYTSGSDAGYLTPPYLPSMPGGAKAPRTQLKTPALNAKKYSGKDQKDNFGLDNRAILNPYLGCFGGAGDRAPSFRRAIVPEEDPFAHNELVSCVGCSKTNVLPNAKIVATGGWDGTIRSWRWNPNVGLSGGHSLSGHTDRVEFLSIADYSNAGAGVIQKPFLCVSGGRDNTVRVWDLERSRETRKMYVFDAVTSGAVDWQSATIAVGSRSGALSLWDLNTGQKRASIRGHQNDVTCVISYNEPSLDGAGLFVSGGADGVVKVWDPRQEVAAATMTGHRRRVFSVCAGPPGVIFAGDFSSSVKTHVLARPSARPRDLPNAPRIDGCEAPISGLEYCSLPNATPRSATNQRNIQNGQPAGVLVSTAAYFPPSQKSKETPLSKAVSNIASTLLLRKTSANASSDHHKDLPVLETATGGRSETSALANAANMRVPSYYNDDDDDTSNDSDDSDSSDAPLGLLHVRCVDGQGVGLSGSLFVEREEGEVVLDSDVDINGGYLYSLPGTEGLLTCAAMSANESTSEVSIFAGAASGAICAWSQGGSLTGLPAEKDSSADYSDDEFHRDWMMNHKTDGFWKSEFSESVDVGCEKYSVD